MSNYKGYRVRINGKTFPNNMIAAGSYKSIPDKKRVASEIKDANGRTHKTYYPSRGAEVSFKIRKRTLEVQEQIKDFFSNDGIYDLVYWDDKAMEYKTGDFELNDIEYQHRNTRAGSILYEETQIKFERV